MGIFSDAWEGIKDVASGISRATIEPVLGIAGKIAGIPSASDRRKAAADLQDQVRAYREQTELTRQELNRASQEQDVQKRRVNEKQIRSLRRNYRSAGVLGTGSNPSTQNDTSAKLGG
jgi:hypothetical protein